jgi:hypothetical protein
MSAQYVHVERRSLREAEERARADAQSCVIRHATVETAAARVRRRLADEIAQRQAIKRQWTQAIAPLRKVG